MFSIIDIHVVALMKIPCNNINKVKIITMVMGNVFQAECWEKNSDEDYFWLIIG